ncbi:hypothetical protein NG99_06040 [Erwinia typographi]|uniref:Uncharacterized protein n=1 Tax=Erwinia typographi TaxID=371042 RepID=A0A0A3ZAZ9_9GAMM|nr:hypothetical protein NG99_06040 [Erwinia typographi]
MIVNAIAPLGKPAQVFSRWIKREKMIDTGKPVNRAINSNDGHIIRRNESPCRGAAADNDSTEQSLIRIHR